MNQYAAAGILPLVVDQENNHHQILLGSEPVTKKGREYQFWGVFGGRREVDDQNDPRQTAWREFHEETNEIFLSKMGNSLLLNQSPWDFDHHVVCRLYCPQSKFVLFVVKVPFVQNLPTFTHEDFLQKKTLNKRRLQWFSFNNIPRWIRDPTTFEHYKDETEMLTPFIISMLRAHFASIEHLFR